MSNHTSFQMTVKQGKNPSLFDDKLVNEINGEATRRKQFTVYALLDNFDVLAEADTLERRTKRFIFDESNEQGVRVSAVVHKVNDIGFYMTTRMSHGEITDVEQVMCPISEAMYNHLAIISTYGIEFERFKFNIPNSTQTWEIDVYRGRDGQRHPWVKCDIEVDSVDDEIPKCPIECREYILDHPGIVSETQRSYIESLYKHQWLSLDPEWIMNQVDYKELVGRKTDIDDTYRNIEEDPYR